MSKIPLTVSGAERLRSELQRLKTVDRPAAIAAIGEARLHGDISENAEYDAAKDRQGFIEGRIARIEDTLANAHIVDPAQVDAEGRIVFGATVDLEDLELGTEVRYQIVGDDEADIKASKISIESPIARALIGKGAGDIAEVQAPGGVREYEVLGVRYIWGSALDFVRGARGSKPAGSGHAAPAALPRSRCRRHPGRTPPTRRAGRRRSRRSSRGRVSWSSRLGCGFCHRLACLA